MARIWRTWGNWWSFVRRVFVVHCRRAENRILRDKLPKRLTITVQERQRLLKYGKPLGKSIRDLITIVSPRTFARWLSGEAVSAKGVKPAGPERPKTAEDIRALVLRLARENAWGYTRILGALKKLSVHPIASAGCLPTALATASPPRPAAHYRRLH